ncbi:MAG: hypothetical protein HFJ30_01760 [Clostridia bacterium]|jgi:adenylate cyclase class IV|nr:hypothetical protein [Clostridia bacterium]
MSNEITVKLKCSIEELSGLLESKGFKVVDKYFLNDTYFIPRELKIEDMTPREILRKAVLLRDITEFMPERKIVKLTFKSKTIDNKGIILEQSKNECELTDAIEGKKFLQAIGYTELMNIHEIDIEYEKEQLKISIKDIQGGDQLIEIETVEENSELDTIEKIKQKISELQIPIDTNDYFVKKAEIELSKIL